MIAYTILHPIDPPSYSSEHTADDRCWCAMSDVAAKRFLLHCSHVKCTAPYRVTQKIGTIILCALTLPNINRFSKLFHYQNFCR